MRTTPYAPTHDDTRAAIAQAYAAYLNEGPHNPISEAYLGYVERCLRITGKPACQARHHRIEDLRCGLPAGEDHRHLGRVPCSHNVVQW